MEQKAEDHIHDIHTSAELQQLGSIEDSALRLHSVLFFACFISNQTFHLDPR